MEVVLKDIKNILLSVYPAAGAVQITAPRRTNMDTLRVFTISKLAWTKQQHKKLREQARQSQREPVDRKTPTCGASAIN